MSAYVRPQNSISASWIETLRLVSLGGGRVVNVLTTVLDPGAEEPRVRRVLDELLVPGHRGGTRIQSIETVANTIFPRALYRDPGFSWAPGLDATAVGALDSAAASLFGAYAGMLPLLVSERANSRGTYFGRMVSWPGRTGAGTNQLADRIRYLRGAHENGRGAENVNDIAVGGEGDIDLRDDEDAGLQVYAAGDRRRRGFPCLVHVDLTLLDGRLHMLAVYRHQYLVTKAYGNLLGLSRLLSFLAQQSGFAVGELAVQATLADDERSTFGGQRGIAELLALASEEAQDDQ